MLKNTGLFHFVSAKKHKKTSNKHKHYENQCKCKIFCFTVDENNTALVLDNYPPPDICEPIFRLGDWLKIVSE